jgi:5-(carboxyamino)imidazole ribonucleotide synthase
MRRVLPGGNGKLLIVSSPRALQFGHLTVDACVTSQFEQQLRAVCGMPLGSTELLRPAAMPRSARRSLGERRARLESLPDT